MKLRRAIETDNIGTQPVLPYITPKTYSWTLERPGSETELADITKHCIPREQFRFMAQENIQRYSGYVHIYTDGSKGEGGVGAAALMGNRVRRSLPPVASVLTAELQAIQLAISIVDTTAHTKFVIITDSLNAISSLTGYDRVNHMVERLRIRMHDMITKGKEIGCQVTLWCKAMKELTTAQRDQQEQHRNSVFITIVHSRQQRFYCDSIFTTTEPLLQWYLLFNSTFSTIVPLTQQHRQYDSTFTTAPLR